MNHRLRHIEEKGAVFVPLDEIDRMFGVPGGEHRLIFTGNFGVDHLVAFDQGQIGIAAFTADRIGWKFGIRRVQRPHVVRIGEPKIFIEPVL